MLLTEEEALFCFEKLEDEVFATEVVMLRKLAGVVWVALYLLVILHYEEISGKKAGVYYLEENWKKN